MKKEKQEIVKSAQIVTFNDKSFMYVVTESGKILYCEHNPENNEAVWTNIPTPQSE